MTVIERIIDILDQKNLQQKDLCDAIQINSSTFSTWKKRFTNIPTDKAVLISKFLKVPLLYLLTGEGQSEIPQLSEQEIELLRIYKSLNIKGQAALISKAYELEEEQ